MFANEPLALACFAFAAVLLLLGRRHSGRDSLRSIAATHNFALAAQGGTRLPYLSRNHLLTQGEAAFFEHLSRAVGRRYYLAAKVRLADVITCPDHLWRTEHGRRIAQKHLDFVLCDPRSTKILLAIELNGRSHEAAERARRDAFVNRALAAAGVPLLTLSAQSSYDRRDLADVVRSAVAQRPLHMRA